jgi:predicted permease
MKQLLRRLQYLLRWRRFDQELAEDMEFHREMAARAGNPNFGNALHLREEARDAWGWTWIDRFLQDLRYAARMLRKSPGFTLAAVLILALGIGVNVAVFGFFNLMVLRPLPVRDPGTLRSFQRQAPQNFADNFPFPEVAFIAEHSRKLSAVLAVDIARLTITGEAKPLDASFVTANYFSELGAVPRLGRTLLPAMDEVSGAAPVVFLGYASWQGHFGGDPSIVGRTIRLNNKPATVIGVASSQFSGLGLGTTDVWALITQAPYFLAGRASLTDFSDQGIHVLMWGRLRAGLAPSVAEAELASLAAHLRRQHPNDIWEKENLPSEPGGYAMTVRAQMYPLLGLVGTLCLLILAAACATLSSLLLARGVARQREIAIRTAVGAGRSRLMRQLFTESMLLALLGSAAGLALGYMALRILMAATGSPAWLDPAPDWRVMVFALAAGFACAILFGLTPAWQVARQRYRATRMRQILIGSQVAASCVLLIVAGLLVHAFNQAISTPPGFAYERVIALDPILTGYSPAQARAYFDRLWSRLSHVPGIESVSMASNPPLGNRWTVAKANIAGRTVNIHFNNVDPQFFQTMQIPLLRGGSLVRDDPRAIVVSQSLARLQWPLEDPIGKQFRQRVDPAGAPANDIVVGVSGDARLVSPEDSDAVEVYRLAQQDILPAMVVLVRTSGPPEAVARLVASIARSIDPKLFPEAKLLKNSFRQKVQDAGYATMAAGLLSLVAQLLACLGILGVVAYGVSQRTKEIGIRMALGAKPSHILSVVLRQFSVPVGIGLLLGVGGAAALSQFLRGVLYGVSNLDPITYLGAIAVFLVTVALAALLPARRALRIDPLRALRYE